MAADKEAHSKGTQAVVVLVMPEDGVVADKIMGAMRETGFVAGGWREYNSCDWHGAVELVPWGRLAQLGCTDIHVMLE